jgi:N4-(beta-N-acetylglucosaminyl)-L-asparaginase
MFASTALPAAAMAPANARNVVISSENGVAACMKAMSVLNAGGDTLDAVIAGVNIVELDPTDDSVGYGGLPNEDGIVELDASVMHGPTRRAGSVGAIRNVKTPSLVAKAVMEQTTHVMLVGEGATRFAKMQGFREEDLLTEHARMAWLMWKKTLRTPAAGSNWAGSAKPPVAELRREFPEATEAALALAWKRAIGRPITGTINCLSLNAKGEMSGVTTTSGLAWKIPGRVGDSPIIGAGLYVDQDVGAAGSTGLGEENIRVAGAHTIVENMRRGMTPEDACLDAVKRVARNYDGDRAGLQRFDLNFYALRKDGLHGGATVWNDPRTAPKRYAVNDGGDTRLQKCAFLLQR